MFSSASIFLMVATKLGREEISEWLSCAVLWQERVRSTISNIYWPFLFLSLRILHSVHWSMFYLNDLVFCA